MEEEETTAATGTSRGDGRARADCTGGRQTSGPIPFLDLPISLFLFLSGRSGTGSIPVRRLE